MGGKLSCIPKLKKYGHLDDVYSCETEIILQQNASSDDALVFDVATAEQSVVDVKTFDDCVGLKNTEIETLKSIYDAQPVEQLDSVQRGTNLTDELGYVATVAMKNNEETTPEYVVCDLPYTILDHKDSATADLLHHQQLLQNIRKSKFVDSTVLLQEWQNSLQTKMIEKQKKKWMDITKSEDFQLLSLAKQQQIQQLWERRLCCKQLQ